MQVSFSFVLASPFCCPDDCLDELPLARFLLKDPIGGQPTTGTEAPLPWACGLLRPDAAGGACDGGAQHPFFLSLTTAIFCSSVSSFPHPALACCFCSSQPSVLASMVSKNTLFVPVVVVFVVGFEGSRKQQRERAGLSRCITSCLDTVAVSSSTRPGRPSFSSSFLSSSLPKPVFLDLPSPRASLASRSFPSGIRSSSRGRVSLPLESPIGLFRC